ncbi:MAG: hypothetical protein IKH41_06530 [Clostridia bacterium]|nr:hypothetical protein [Clostridia bacterium]
MKTTGRYAKHTGIIKTAAALLALILLLSFAAGCTKNPAGEKVDFNDTGIYNALPAPDYLSYTGFGPVTTLLGVDNVLALYKDVKLAYYRAGLTETGEALLKEESGLKLNVTECAKMLGREDSRGWIDAVSGAQVASDLTVTVYDGRMAVITLPENAPDTFNDLYTLEYLSLMLRGAADEDKLNAFITLPSKVSNGTNTVYYTAPDLNLGLQTNLYYAQMGDANVTAGPAIVAGQGKADGNYTLVRVFNRQQAISAQFLAFPADVRGGVRVAAAAYSMGDKKETLIAAASFSGKGTGADAVRIFDTSGVIRAAFVPEGIDAPYTIATGRFKEGSSDEYLAVMGADHKANGKPHMNIYSLADMTLVRSIEFEFSGPDADSGLELSLRKGAANDSIIMYYGDVQKAFICDPVKNSIEPLAISLGNDATGVYSSAFEDGFNVTMKDGTFSKIYTYASDLTGGDSVNVGWRENRFYSSFAKNNPDGYVDNGTFHHVRVDLAAPVVGKLKDPAKAADQLSNTEKTYLSQFGVKFKDSAAYHKGYHMWEPCFTHRWNRMTATTVLSQVKDADGNLKYASVGRDNATTDYLELDSAFYIGTYADGVPEMNRMRIYPLRTYLRGLSVDFRGEKAEPEKLISVSPVHEQEINIEGSIGDYNVNMIRGFREYLLGLYGSIDNINARFKTNFASIDDFDAPRFDPKYDDPSKSRGDWDKYGFSDFFTQWSLYTRYIVNKRIMEAYREALLAGFPPEAINAHQIPEGDAVAGFLGQADTRLSPVEAVTVCGTAYGGTRYSLWYTQENNFLDLAFKAGHNNITLGEYGSIATNRDEILAQLRYMFSHGVRMLHMIIPLTPGSKEQTASEKGERYAINTLQEENQPRTVNTGITAGMVPYDNGADLKFNIVQMSRPSEKGGIDTGLLKSINETGGWEGTVYLVPFHANVEISAIGYKGSVSDGFVFNDIKELQCGDQVELTFAADYSGEKGGAVVISAYNGGYLLNDSVVRYELSQGLTPYRYVLSNQLTPENIRLEIRFENVQADAVKVTNMSCTAQYENIAHKYFGDLESAAATGGVTFDLLTRN